ncbi:hypothetical protein U1Q18_039267, partial [Sarracenia purpurea var. burkii]
MSHLSPLVVSLSPLLALLHLLLAVAFLGGAELSGPADVCSFVFGAASGLGSLLGLLLRSSPLPLSALVSCFSSSFALVPLLLLDVGSFAV